jgi:crotonobetainyl-CoA:carnitine CoA-transferase CaiB-like acyl-CoA transferase
MGVEVELLERFWAAVSDQPHPPVSFVGEGTLESRYAVSEFAAAAIATAGLAAGETVVNRALADAWFGQALRPVGWTLPSPWDSIAGDYRTADGWIRLHTNAPHHRLAALLVLGLPDSSVPMHRVKVVGRQASPAEAPDPQQERLDVAAAVAEWKGLDLETEIVDAGGAAAVLRAPAEWAAHPQGAAVAAEPLIAWTMGSERVERVEPVETKLRDEPLDGIRILDLTRVIAGPVATRFLAGLGANVLRIDPPDWDEPAIVPEMTLGKRSARLDLLDADGLRTLRELIAQADVIVHGYRADALERLGLGDEQVRALNPGIVDVAINAYGWSGPWRNRRGFDSLVQMSSGLAFDAVPSPLPAQALDHATGYLAAAAVLEGLRRRRQLGLGSSARLSLARTALELPLAGRVPQSAYRDRGADAPPLRTASIATPWGSAALLQSPLTIDRDPLNWTRMPRPLGADAPTF